MSEADEVYMRCNDPEANLANMKAFAARMERERDEARAIAAAWRKCWAEEAQCPWEPQFPWTTTKITPQQHNG